MPLKHFLCLSCLCLAFCGCTTEMIQETAPRKGPIAAVGYIDPGGGEIRYSAQGWGLVLLTRRETAFYRMRRACKGLGVKVVDEFVHTDVEVPYNSGDLEADAEFGISHYNLQAYDHILFECVPPPTNSQAPEPTPAPLAGVKK